MSYLPHEMPTPIPRIPWSSNEMPWTSNATCSGVMEFTAIPNNPILQHQINPMDFVTLKKRKAEPESLKIPKMLITDEIMAEHLNSMHISNNYTSHNKANENFNNVAMSFEQQKNTKTRNNIVFLSPQELEQKLKTAQRITVCEEVRKLKNELLPTALLKHIERPCTALVLWQPPRTNFFGKKSNSSSTVNEECKGQRQQQAQDVMDEEPINNNNNYINSTNKNVVDSMEPYSYMDLDL